MYLLTPSLLNSFSYYFEFRGETSESDSGIVTAEQKEQAVRQDFLNTLSREKSHTTEAMQAGIDFENRVQAYCMGAPDENDAVRGIGDLVHHGLWQQAMKRELDGFLLYARADVIKRDTIYDIKHTSSYEVGKYQKSAQHRIEFYCCGLPKFSYLVSDGRSWWREDYFNHPGIEQEIKDMIRAFTGYLENDAEAKALYCGKWRALEKAA